MPANLLLGARYLHNRELEKFATELMDGCYKAWNVTATGIAPETWSWIDRTQNISNYPTGMQMAMQTTGYIPQDLSYDLRPGKCIMLPSFPPHIFMIGASRNPGKYILFLPPHRKQDLSGNPPEYAIVLAFGMLNASEKEMAWNIFQAIEKYCKTPSGYTRIADVSNVDAVRPLDFEER